MSSPTHFVNIQVTPDKGLLEKIQFHQKKLQARLKDPGAETQELPTPMEKENLHLTVCALGLENQQQEAEVVQILQGASTKQEVGTLCEGGPVRVQLRSLDVFLPLNASPKARGPCAVVIQVDEAESKTLMCVIHHLRRSLAGYLRERPRDLGLPYCPHITIAGNCYHDNPASILDAEDRVTDLGVCVVSRVYLSKMGDTTERGIYKHHATLLLHG